MRGVAAVVSSVCLLVVFNARVVNAQARDAGSPPGPLSVHVGAGVGLPHGNDTAGDVQSVSIGYSPTPKLTILASAWRMHTPTDLRIYGGGSSAFSRGETSQFVSGELRFRFGPVDRVAPYAFTGLGIGVTRPNVDDNFPNSATYTARVIFGGGGLSFPVGQRLSVSGDLGFHLFGEGGGVRLMIPLRASLAWRF